MLGIYVFNGPIPTRALGRLLVTLPQSIVQPQVIPTTSNPTINVANGGVRTMQNMSFKQYGTCTPPTTSWSTIRMENMFGWKTTQPYQIENCNGGSRGGSYRVIEIQGSSAYGYVPENGSVYAELNAYNAGMLYQTLCVQKIGRAHV